MYTRRTFGNIKSLLHFDYPYHGAVNSGLLDECSVASWTKYGNALSASNFEHADIYFSNAPKFGYRCLYTQSASDYIQSANSIFNSANFDAEIFICVKSSTAGIIFALLNGNSPVISLSVSSSRALTLNSQASSFIFALDTWCHIKLSCSGNSASVFADGACVINSASVTNTGVTGIRIGGAHAMFDEFAFRQGNANASVPSKPYQGALDIVKAGGFGDGHDGALSWSSTSNFTVNSWAEIKSVSGNSLTLKTPSGRSVWTSANAAYAISPGDEVLITPNMKSSYQDYSGCYAFRHITSVNGSNITLNSPVTEEFDMENIFTQYNFYILKVPNFSAVNVSNGSLFPVKPGFCVFRSKGDCVLNPKRVGSKTFSGIETYPLSHSELPDRIFHRNGAYMFFTGGTFSSAPTLYKLGAVDQYGKPRIALLIAAKKIKIDPENFAFDQVINDSLSGRCYMAGDLI